MLKTLLYNRFNPLPFLIPMRSMISLSGQRLILVVYHALCDEVPDSIKHLYEPRSVKAFSDDMHYLMRFYEPIDLHRLIDMTTKQEKPGKNHFFVSFDDGLREFYTHAVPILKEMGIPATCFLNTTFIDNKDLFYRYKVSILIEEIQKHKSDPDFWKKFHTLKEKFSIPQGYYRTVLLNLDHTGIPFIDETARLIHLDFDAYLRKQQPYLTSDQIRELIAKGFTFGGHSIDHPNFSRLPEEEMLRQARQSAAEVSKRYDLPYQVFAFPFTDFGIRKSFFDSLYAHEQISLSFGCAGIKRDSAHRNLQRIPMEEFNLSGVRRLRTDYFYYLVKAIAGQNIIIRK